MSSHGVAEGGAMGAALASCGDAATASTNVMIPAMFKRVAAVRAASLKREVELPGIGDIVTSIARSPARPCQPRLNGRVAARGSDGAAAHALAAGFGFS